MLRGLAARPPYFHNGSAADLGEVVDFYDTRFAIGFTDREKADLVAFLRPSEQYPSGTGLDVSGTDVSLFCQVQTNPPDDGH